GSALYAPFLVLAARSYAASATPAAGGGTNRPSVYFPMLEDPAILGVSVAAQPGETAAAAIARLEAFVAGTIAPELGKQECSSVRRTLAFFLGTAEIPDSALAQNPYGVALALARREQLEIDPRKLNQAFDSLTEKVLRRAAEEIFAPDRHAGAFVSGKDQVSRQ
ncbi:MAG: M16 family metallopeptidase, partial [Isosphaeraceae bacterium]